MDSFFFYNIYRICKIVLILFGMTQLGFQMLRSKKNKVGQHNVLPLFLIKNIEVIEKKVNLTRLELVTVYLEGRCSIQLSYRSIKLVL
jgi:hypothetical protein